MLETREVLNVGRRGDTGAGWLLVDLMRMLLMRAALLWEVLLLFFGCTENFAADR